MLAAEIVELCEQIDRADSCIAVDRDGLAFFEADRDLLGLSGAFSGDLVQQKDILRRRGPRVFENAALVGDVHQVAVHRVRFFGAVGDRNAVLLGE